MSLISIQNKIIGIADNGLNTAAEMRILLNELALEHEANEFGLTGVIDGANSGFTTSNSFITGTTKIYVNGLRQFLGTDYTELSGNTITFTTPPEIGDLIIANYLIT